jgi:ATP-binding cassette subfamily B protein
MHSTTQQTLRRFGRYFIQYKMSGLFLIASVILGSIARNIPALYYKKFFDLLAEGEGGSALVAPALIGVLGTIACIEGINWAIQRAVSFLNTYLETRITADVSQDCFETLHRHSFSFFNNNFVGSLVKRAHRFVGALTLVLDQVVWTLLPLFVNVTMIMVVPSGPTKFQVPPSLLVAICIFTVVLFGWFAGFQIICCGVA